MRAPSEHRVPLAASLLTLLLVAGPPLAPDARGDQPLPRPLYVEGYTDQLSYRPGEEVALQLSTSAESVEVEVFRWGAERKSMWKRSDIQAAEHPIPDDASSHGCHWPAAFKLPIPSDWPSGYYHVELRVRDRGGAFVHRNTRTAEGSCFFIVRPAEPGRDTKILIQLSTNTYNAYNNWGGHCLYSFNARNKLQGHRVSFDRPPGSQFPNWEQPFVAWAESHGYRLDYAANSDLELHPELLEHYRLVLSVGHDEYWSTPMRDELEKFIGNGGNVAFFSGNTCCWQVRTEDDGRALTCWKQWYNLDPLYRHGDAKLVSTLWGHHLLERPENTLTGVGFLWGGYHRSHGQYMDGPAAFTVHRPEHWLYEGTGLKRGDAFGGKDTIVGYECDGCELDWREGLPFATHRDGTPESFVVLGTCPARWHPDDAWWYERFPEDREGNAVLGVYQRNGTVVTCGSTDWAHGLRGADPFVQRITQNVLDRLGK